MEGSKTLRIIGIILLLVAIPKLPYGYYTFLRFAIAGISVYMVYLSAKNHLSHWAWIFGAIAVLFNPIIPIYLSKEIWVPIDIIVAVIYVISIFTIRVDSTDISL